MRNFLKSKLVIVGIFMQGAAFAQGFKFCGTDEAQRLVFKEHPELELEYLQREEEAIIRDKREAASNYAEARATNVVRIIPVVFHIIHQYGPENLSDAKIKESIEVMNEDFRKQNPDSGQTIALYKPLMADCEIEFRLATIDPNGNCTNGIERFYSWETNNGGESAKFNQWPQNKYLNIWVVKKMGPSHLSAAAYSYLPGTAPGGGDGIICLYDYVGTNSGNSHTLSHEVGHWLNLKHTWGSGNQPNVACGDDNVSDTPITKGSSLVCNLNLAACNPPTIENVQNFMDYSFCTTMFTSGQKARMNAALLSIVAGRSNLSTSSNLLATGTAAAPTLCAADFVSNNFNNIVCEDGLVSFSDVSYNGTVTSRTWTFPGGTLNPPSQQGDSTITVKYLTAGVYDVGLSATNTISTVNTTKNQYITVLPNVASYNTNSYTESFETALLPNADWEVKSPDGGNFTWQQFSTAGASGAASAFIENYSADSADVDELISPTVNVQNIGSSYLKFKFAFRKKTSADNDALKVFVSSDCGKSWSLRKTITGASLATVATPSTQYFIPTAIQWKQDSASIASVINKTNVRFKFQFISGGGNNIYLDDINLIGTTGINSLVNTSPVFTLYPNPAKETTRLNFYLNAKSAVDIELVDLLGKSIEHLASEKNQLEPGNHQYEINSDKRMAPGVYFVKLQVNSIRSIKKLVIN
ncbi:MAG: T9SS type A sorting domain-containing protein [Bacteroidetes bacterium]|nr:T9SS type A sorting domain-containing protein [Bacteroidota bacterium]